MCVSCNLKVSSVAYLVSNVTHLCNYYVAFMRRLTVDLSKKITLLKTTLSIVFGNIW